LEQWKKLSDQDFISAARRKNVPPKTPKSEGTHDTKPAKVVPFGGR
jgi:hypothetical protein